MRSNATAAKASLLTVHLGSRQVSYRRNRYLATVRDGHTSLHCERRRTLARTLPTLQQPSESAAQQRCGEYYASPRRPPRCRRR